MSRSEALYGRLPPWAQSAALSAYGARLNRDRRTGSYRDAARRLEDLERQPADALRRAEDRQLAATIRHAVDHVPHYRRAFRAAGIDPRSVRTREDLVQLPMLEKDVVQTSGSELVSEATPRRHLRHFSSGGTTGTSISFAVDTASLQLGYAIFHTYQWRWAGIELGEPWVMINGRAVVPLDQDDPPFWRRNRAANEHFFSCFHIRPDTMRTYLDAMARIRPAMLHLYPSNAEAFARFIRDEGLTGIVRPRAIITTSETLFPEARALIEEQFGCPVFNHYTADYSVQICQCEHGGLHIAPDFGLVELVPIEGSDVPGLCEMVITGLANRGTMLIRYRVGDTAVAATGPCGCGRSLPRVGMLWGRTGDVVTTPEGNMINASNLTDVFKATPAIRRCQFVQTDASTLVARMEVGPGFGDRDEADLLAALRSRVGRSMTLRTEVVDRIELTSSGKFRFVISAP